MKTWWMVAMFGMLAACGPDERTPNNPYVPTNNTTSNNTTSNNTTTQTNNTTSATNNGTTQTTNMTTIDPGDYVVALDEDCEGVAGLTGDALLAGMTETLVVNMADIDPDTNMHVNPREVTITLTWPAAPVASCYPELDDGVSTIGPRLGIDGLSLAFTTTDGEFDEQIPATAWLSTNGATVGSPSVAAQIAASDLSGSYVVPDHVLYANPLLSVFTTLNGALGARGNLAASRADSAALSYGSFTGRQIVSEWPYQP